MKAHQTAPAPSSIAEVPAYEELLKATPAASSSAAPAAEAITEAKLDLTLQGHTKPVNALASFANGLLASGSDDCSIKVWDSKTGECVATLMNTSAIKSLVALSSKERLVSGSGDHDIKLWDLKKKECVGRLYGHTDAVHALIKLKNEEIIASGSQDNTVRLWSSETGGCIAKLLHQHVVYALAALPDERLVSAGSGGGSSVIKIWNLDTYECIATLCEKDSFRSIYSLAALSNGWIASASKIFGRGSISLWDSNIPLWNSKILCSPTSLLTDINHISPGTLVMLDDKHLASGGGPDSTINLWNFRTGKCVATMKHGDYADYDSVNVIGNKINYAEVSALAKLPDGRLVSGANKNINIWNVGIAPSLEWQKQVETKQEKAQPIAKEKNDKVQEKEKSQDKEKNQEKDKEIEKLRTQLAQLQLQLNAKNQIVDLPASLIISHNELKYNKEELGRGSFGVVHKGEWRFQDVAIKELLIDKPSAEILKDFKEEMGIMAKLRSDHLVRLNGYILGNPKYCIVMQYMPKGSLFSVLRSEQPLDWAVRYKMTLNIACGLAYLHRENILHRDLKSLNVLLDEHYNAKLTDFGLSKVKTETRLATKNQGAVGTDGWLAPELTQPNVDYTPECDVFSLGVTVWEIASRKIPYEKAPNRAFISFWYANNKREEIPKDCPKKIASLIEKCWNTDPTKRPTAAQIVNYLRSDAKEFDDISDQTPRANDGIQSFPAPYQGNLSSSLLPLGSKKI